MLFVYYFWHGGGWLSEGTHGFPNFSLHRTPWFWGCRFLIHFSYLTLPYLTSRRSFFLCLISSIYNNIMSSMSLEEVKAPDAEFVEERSIHDEEWEKEEKALVRKVDLMLLPTMWLMYLLSYMDRTNIGNAKIAGMVDDLNMHSNEYSVSLVVVSSPKLFIIDAS